MKLHAKQQEVVKDKHRFRVFNAGRRLGKTVLAVDEMVFNAITLKDSKSVYIAPTYQAARDICWEQLKARVAGIDAKVNESRLDIELPNEHGDYGKIFLRSWDNIETLRGQAFDFIIMDEVAMFRNFWSGWQEVLRPTLTDRKGRALFISTPKGFNHFYDLYNLETQDPAYKSFHATSYDNPFIDAEEIDEARKQLTEDQFFQEYMADFRKQEGLVYKEFNRKQHVVEEIPNETEMVEYLAGIDFGYTNPAAVVHIKKDIRGFLWVVDEWYERGRTEDQVADYIRSCGFNAVYADPENPSAIQTLNQKGVNVREVVKNKDSIVNGIQRVRELLKQQKLRIHSRCINLIAEFEMYAYPDNKDGSAFKEVPVKQHDHALDALRYVIMSSEPKPVNYQQRGLNYRERMRNIANRAR